jgi:hypothetical protein
LRRSSAPAERKRKTGRLTDRFVFAFACHADNLHERAGVAIHPEALPDWVFMRPEAVTHRSIDDGNARRSFVVRFRKDPTTKKSYAHRFEIGRINRVGKHLWGLLARRGGTTLNRNCTADWVTAHGHVCSEARGLDAGQGAHSSFNLAIECSGPRLVEARRVRVHQHIEDVAGVEPEIEGLNLCQAADEKPCSHQQCERTPKRVLKSRFAEVRSKREEFAAVHARLRVLLERRTKNSKKQKEEKLVTILNAMLSFLTPRVLTWPGSVGRELVDLFDLWRRGVGVERDSNCSLYK